MVMKALWWLFVVAVLIAAVALTPKLRAGERPGLVRGYKAVVTAAVFHAVDDHTPMVMLRGSEGGCVTMRADEP